MVARIRGVAGKKEGVSSAASPGSRVEGAGNFGGKINHLKRTNFLPSTDFKLLVEYEEKQ
jgi:hypothetical protein